MRVLLFLLLPFYLFAEPFKVASYNVQNLFDVEFQGTEYKEYIPKKHNWNQKMMNTKLSHIAEVICDLNADIIGLQEIENSKVFELLLKRLKNVGCEYPYSSITLKRKAPIQVALLSKFPIKKEKELQVNYSPYVRNILEVEVSVKGNPLTIFVNHWKSKSRNGVESKRIKYAKKLQKRVLTFSKNREYIILGDLNSNYDAHVTLSRKLNDSKGVTAIGDILQTTTKKKLLKKHQISHSKRGSHFNTWQEIPYKERWSHKYYGNRSTLDHILLPSSMFNAKGIEYVNSSFNVFKPSYLFTKRGYINRWQYKNGKHKAKGYSDHLPVFAFFDTKPHKHKKILEENSVVKVKDIAYLYSLSSLKKEIRLNDVVVLLKRGNHAIIKQDKNGRGIYLYACAKGLEEGYSYDILVQDIETYKGLKEITNLLKITKKSKVKLSDFYIDIHANETLKQNEVAVGLVGIYKNKKLLVKGKKIPIYFKKKSDTPLNGTKIKIDYAHIGYYKKIQLVVYSTNDFTILEK
ncbi:MAG: endonuclease/exonuclease/phosphatase family protein [Campylobacterota bacterium]|nr:endonuclease/exonuclease/phosphatase family protein [Campylobacterota bacterium]